MKRLKKAVYSACFIAGAVQLTACTPKVLYGPPPAETTLSPETEVPEVVYGPPEMLDPSASEIPEDVYGPPVTQYEPEEEVPEDVYGPPASFDIEEAPADLQDPGEKK